MIIAEKHGRRRNSTSTAELTGPSSPSAGFGRGRQPSPMRTGLTRSEYNSSFREAAASPRDRALSRGLSDRVRKSDQGGSSKTEGGATSSSPQLSTPQSPKPASAAARQSPIGYGLSRQVSDKNGVKGKSLLSSTGELPAAFRQAARVTSYNARGSTPLSQTMPTLLRGSGRAPGTNVEQEAQLGDALLGFGSNSFQGLRDYQEDTVAFVSNGNCLAGAVYDGHGGDQISKELERVLLQNMLRNIGDQDSVPAIQNAIGQAYVATNKEICMRMASSSEAGSCAVTFLVTRAAGALHLFIANAGDCRAVLCTGPAGNKRAVRLSEDHKPHPQVCPSEIKRVTSAGGCVLWGRVQGCLAVSRAFGDKALHPYVIAEPFISARPLNLDQDSFFYLASDGVTDMVDDATGCQVIAEQLARGQTTSQAAAALVSAAYQKGSSDNISVIVVRLRRRG